MKTMNAAILFEQNQPLRIEAVSIPDLREGQILVKIHHSGVCHSQLNEIRGEKGPDKYLPHTLGHEGAGVVESIGEGVTKIKKGDHVVLSWIKSGGINAVAPEYYLGTQRINSGQLSTFNEYTVTSENRITLIDKKMPLDKAALIGCAVATGMGSVFNDAKLNPGETIAVFGIGGIGLSAVHASAISKASIIIAVDVSLAKLEKARAMGATHIINANDRNIESRIQEITSGKGVDYAIEAAGRKLTMEEAFRSVRDNGGRTIIVGNLPQGEQISIDPFALICGKQISGSWGGSTNPDKDFPHYVDLYLSGTLRLDDIMTHRFQLKDINKAFELLEKGEIGRGIIDF